MARRQPTRKTRRNLYICEPLERRLLLKTVQINGTDQPDTIVISAHLRLGIQWFVDYAINGGATQSVGVFPTDNIAIDTIANSNKSQPDTVIIQKTPPIPINITGHAVEINGALNYDELKLGDANGVQDIAGRTNVTSPNWAITADDSGDAAALRHVTISNGLVSGLAPADISLQAASSTYVLTIKAGSVGGSAFDVSASYVSTLIVAASHTPDDTLNVHNASSVDLESPGGVTGLWDLNIDESNSPPASGQPILQNNAFLLNGSVLARWSPAAIDTLSIVLPSVGARIFSTNVPTTVSGNTARVGNLTEGLRGIVSNLSLAAGNIVFDDTVDVSARTFTVARASSGSDVAIDGLAPATITYSNQPTSDGGPQQVEFDLPSEFDGSTVNMQGAGQPGGSTAIVSARSVTVNVGNATTVPDVLGTLKISGRTLALHVNDSADTVARNVGITAGEDGGQNPIETIHGLLANGDILYSTRFAVSPVVIDGGSSGNAFTVSASQFKSGDDPTAVGLLLNTGSGNDLVDIKTNPVTVNGQAGNDSVIVDLTGVAVPNAGTFFPRDVTVDGGPGSNTLTTVAPPGSSSLTVSPTDIVSSIQTTTYSNIQSLVLPPVTSTASADLNGLNVTAPAGSNLVFNSTQHLGTLQIAAGARVTLLPTTTPVLVAGALAPAAATLTTLFVAALSIDPAGSLDMGNNALELTYSGADPVGSIRSYLASGYDHGAWDGTGIVCSSANPTHGLGLADSADQAGLPANTLLVRWIAYGDANLDGKVDFADLVILARNYGRSVGPFSNADFNGDGAVGFDDLVILARNYGAVTPLDSLLSPQFRRR